MQILFFVLIKENLAKVKKRIGNSKASLIVVTKNRSLEQIQQVIDLGQKHFAESYVKEALTKINAFREKNLVWHFIGPIQSNKTKQIAQNFSWVHSIDRLKIAKRLNAQRPKNLDKINVLLQINIDNESTKSGVLVDEIDEIIPYFKDFERLVLRGFMCIPNIDNTKQNFQKIAKIIKKYPSFDTLSMGMSQDLELAIKNNATFLRIGRDIFE